MADPLSALLGQKKQTEQAKAKAPQPQRAPLPTTFGGGVADVSAALGRPSAGTAGSASGGVTGGSLFDDRASRPAVSPSSLFGDPAPAAPSGYPASSTLGAPRALLDPPISPSTAPSGSGTASAGILGSSGGGSASAKGAAATFEDILEGERVFIVAKQCFLLWNKPLCEIGGRILVTNYRLKFQTPKGTLRDELRWMQQSKYFEVLLGAVESFKEEQSTTNTGALEYKLKIQTKDLRSIVFFFGSGQDLRSVVDAFGSFGTPGNPALLFAFKHAEASGGVKLDDTSGWQLCDPLQEYTRMGVETELVRSPGAPWHVTRINADYSLCSTYPAMLALPKRMTDEDLRAVAGFRKRGRLPSMSWCGGPERNYASLWRCSQTTEGLMGQKCPADGKLVELIRQGADRDHRRDLLVIDLRPWQSAWANKAGGGGFEGYPRCRLVFGGIDNVHRVRDAWRAMGNAVNNVIEGEVGSWWKDVAASSWYDYIGAIMNSTLNALKEMLEHSSSVLVHCSDGWDRTAQVSSLSMLCVDPSYRTQAGFLRLIQKEWCSFGHRFRTRLALGEPTSGEYSPVFIQWLECVFQLCNQFPNAFEFSASVLLRLACEVLSNRYGTFLCDSEKERFEKVMPFTGSLWSTLLRPDEAETWRNPSYQSDREPLMPSVCQANFKIWEVYWFRFHPKGNRSRAPDVPETTVAASRPAPPEAPTPALASVAAGGVGTDIAPVVEATPVAPPSKALLAAAEDLLGPPPPPVRPKPKQVFADDDDEDIFAKPKPKTESPAISSDSASPVASVKAAAFKPAVAEVPAAPAVEEAASTADAGEAPTAAPPASAEEAPAAASGADGSATPEAKPVSPAVEETAAASGADGSATPEAKPASPAVEETAVDLDPDI